MVDLSGANWRKSSASGANGCVEVAFVEGQVAVRDSKDRAGPVLVFDPMSGTPSSRRPAMENST